MGRLFWKFFFSYWAALLMTVVGLAATAWLYRLADRGRSPSLDAGPPAALVVSSAAATLHHGGLQALRALMDDWGGQRLRLLVVDGDGRDLLGRAVPPDALDRARRVVGMSEPSQIARSVRLADGTIYLLFMPVGPTPLQGLPFRGRLPFPMVPLAIGEVASLVFGALLALYVARPIHHLRGGFAALASGRFDTRVAHLMGRRRDEVADLGREFDRMAQQLESLISAQRSLLHDVSHEVRSPLARLQAAIGLVRQSPHRLEASLERIEHEAERLDELMGQLLTLSRLEAGLASGSMGVRKPVDLVDLVASIASDARFEAQANCRDVTFAGEGEITTQAHVDLLYRAVENVVRNAVKYTSPGTTVEVSVMESSGGERVFVRVADCGPGVAVAELEAIFEPFYRGAERQPGPGSGLGLAIASRAVEAHGGNVWATNRPGGGLQIEIDLPIVRN